MLIKEKFKIGGQGTVVSGIVKKGTLQVNDAVEIIGFGKKKQATVKGLESEHKTLVKALPGHNIGVNLRGVEYDEVETGQALVGLLKDGKTSSISMSKKFKAQTYILKTEERGRKSSFFNGYKPQFFFSSLGITGTVELPKDKEVKPGDNMELTVELIESVPIETGSRFNMREGGITVGTGFVTEIIKEKT